MLYGHPAQPSRPTKGCAYMARIAFEWGERSFKAGDDFDYVALGLTEIQAFNLWASCYLIVKDENGIAALADAGVQFTRAASDRVDVLTPKQQRHHQRR